jgi:tRNA-specific 2-thiouridylase
VVSPQGDGSVRVTFDEPQRAIAGGQFAAFYDGDILVGGGVIAE